MKNLKLIFCTVLAVAVFSCKSEKKDVVGLVDKFANLECRAMTLREKRFDLANQIRFTQDTLLHTTNKNDTLRLQSKLVVFNKEKEVILKQSLSLADSIHNQLTDLMQNQLTNKKDKEAFDQLLNNTLQQRGCLKE